jgi:hypothetical protein
MMMSDDVIDPVKDLLQIHCVEDPFWAADRIMELERKLSSATNAENILGDMEQRAYLERQK